MTLSNAHAEQPSPSDVVLTIQADKPRHKISPMLYGIFFEDINYGADGGLYAELVQNRSFEFKGDDALFAWSKVGEGTMTIGTERPLNANNPHYLQLAGCGVANSGFGGIAVRQGENYRFAFHARGTGPVTVSLEGAGGRTRAQARLDGVGSEWKQHAAMLRSTGTEAAARLVVRAAGAVDFDMVSLFPEHTWKKRPNGMRADLVQMLADLKPAFMRFPGGCIVEGKDLANAYRWKDTIGDPATRRMNWNRWQDAVATKAPQYYQSYGLGFFEFFQLCEDIGTQPLPILNCGMSCQYQDKQLVPLDQLGPYIQDALDLIEYANGPATSPWGAKRAAAGHPEPFHLKYLGVGNEQWGEQYFERYKLFYDAIKAKYPTIQLVTTSGPGVDDNWWRLAWGKFKSGTPADIVDEHYYRPPGWFLENADRYDNTDRNGPKVFAGEYAAHGAGRHNNLEAALAEAAFMTGLERNSDVVVMSSYAPLFAKVGSTQWNVDLIWFDNTRVYGTPSYYVQQMFSRNRGDVVLPMEISEGGQAPSPAGGIGLCTYHTQAEFKDVRVTKGVQTLLAAALDKDAAGWTPNGGRWEVVNGAYRQSDAGAVTWTLAGDSAWSDYTLHVKARKLGGAEGFIISVRNYERDSCVQWNLGGWGNKQHGIQVVKSGQANLVAEMPGSIETGRWYDIRIELKNTRLDCYLDGKLLQSADVPLPKAPGLFATASRDEATGQLILKVVNPTGQPVPTTFKINGVKSVGSVAQVIMLTGAKVTDENSLNEPTKVAPTTSQVSGIGTEFTQSIRPYSLTVWRVATK